MKCQFARVLAAVGVSLAVAACSGNPPQQRQAQSAGALVAPGSVGSCAGQPPVGPLPVWVRAGFSPPDVAMPHVMGSAGNIVAILWATPHALHAPPLQTRANKILWVARVAFGPMTIRATLAGSTRTATVYLPNGPGPSYVNMPVPGCWTMNLSWGGRTDRLSLQYVR